MKVLSTVFIVITLSFLLLFCGCSKTKVEEPQVDINTTVETVELTEPESETETVIITTSEETQKETRTEVKMNESHKKIARGYISERTKTNFDKGLKHYFTDEEIAVLEKALASDYSLGEKHDIEKKYIIRMFDESESMIYEFIVDDSGNVYSVDFCPVLNDEINALIKEIIK